MEDLDEMNIALKTVGDNYTDAVWIGLWRGRTWKWYWSLAYNNLYKEGERNYMILKSSGGDNCAVYRNGLVQSACTYKIPFVCFDRTRQGADQYILSNEQLAWTEARDVCRTNFTDLVSLRNDAEHQMVQELTSGQTVYLGLFKDPWVWSDMSDSSLRYWKKSQPVNVGGTDNCVAMLKMESGRWGNRNCNETHPFLCKCSE
ncbi:C-type lectin BML-2-like [Austrofundulus limnaeus]|uniref:C-type lectin BML-2-like n=1 Tax=Austrofundulus limnaeus TaxID=52670 RepID=A0A2I4B5A8_AUSLI|nr:PREDICTED: C-type lectin BML-2-like [Austrofundulus limnaeus]